MTDVTRILAAIDAGEPHAAEQLLPLVYDELRRLAARKLAREKPGQTLQATALVHEAYLRLLGSDAARSWNNRGHFFASAAEAMRRILIERARGKKRLKWGGDWRRVDLDRLDLFTSVTPDQLLELDEDGTERGREFKVRTPMQRFGQAEELQGAAIYLASDAARFVTGQVLSVDGGFLASGVNQ